MISAKEAHALIRMLLAERESKQALAADLAMSPSQLRNIEVAAMITLRTHLRIRRRHRQEQLTSRGLEKNRVAALLPSQQAIALETLKALGK